MKKIFKTLVFIVGVDVLGFPQFCSHKKTDFIIIDSKYFRAYSKN